MLFTVSKESDHPWVYASAVVAKYKIWLAGKSRIITNTKQPFQVVFNISTFQYLQKADVTMTDGKILCII